MIKINPLKIVSCLCLAFSHQLFAQNSIVVLEDGLSEKTQVINALQNHLKSTYKLFADSLPKMTQPQTTQEKNLIYVSVGYSALENALNKDQTLSIATILTQAEIIKIIKQYPHQVKDIVFVMSQPGFRCQMDLFKQQHNDIAESESLGVLLKNETKMLLPLIKHYAQKIAIKVSPWIIYGNENLAEGLAHLFKNNNYIMLPASPEFNNSQQLGAMQQQSSILDKPLIASAVEQMQLGFKKGCIFKNIDLFTTIDSVVTKLKGGSTALDTLKNNEFNGFHVVQPQLTIIDG